MRLNPRKTESIVVSWSRVYASGYSDLTLGGEELEDVKSLRIYSWGTFDFRLTSETHLREVVSYRKQLGAFVSCAEQESYLIVHVCLRAVSLHMFAQAG